MKDDNNKKSSKQKLRRTKVNMYKRRKYQQQQQKEKENKKFKFLTRKLSEHQWSPDSVEVLVWWYMCDLCACS